MPMINDVISPCFGSITVLPKPCRMVSATSFRPGMSINVFLPLRLQRRRILWALSDANISDDVMIDGNVGLERLKFLPGSLDRNDRRPDRRPLPAGKSDFQARLPAGGAIGR